MVFNLTSNQKTISNLPVMDEEDTLNELRAELDAMLNSLQLINYYNSRGKTKKIADEIRTILTSYNRN
jgi:hypothetical protein